MASTVEQRLKEVAAVGQEIAETGIAYLDGAFVPMAEAKVSLATHALQYGTGVFEGIRAYWKLPADGRRREPGARQAHRGVHQHRPRGRRGARLRSRRGDLPHGRRSCVGGRRCQRLHGPRGCPHDSAGHRGHPRRRDARIDPHARKGAWDPHRGASHRPDRALRRGRGVLLWNGRAGRAVRRDRPATGWRRGDRPDRQADRRPLLRDRARGRQEPRGVAHGGVPLSQVAYQGLAGAFSEAAAAALFPGAALVPRRTFAEVFAALEADEVSAAVVPVENTHAGSVADVYDLLRHHERAKVIGELILRVRHSLLGVTGARLEGVRIARSHPQALAQVEEFLSTHAIRPDVAFDTAGAAAEVAAAADPEVAAVASRRAAARYGLDILAESIETSRDNFTRVFALARDGDARVAEQIPASLRK